MTHAINEALAKLEQQQDELAPAGETGLALLQSIYRNPKRLRVQISDHCIPKKGDGRSHH